MWKGAVVGLGNIALRAHLPAYQADETLQGKVRIIAGVDPLPAHRLEAERIVPGLRTYESLDALLAQENPDFVDICTPPHAHLPLIQAAARQDCHILCEKPFARSLRDARTIGQALEDSDVIFMPCHQYRYSLVWSRLKQLLTHGKIGAFGFAQIDIMRQGPDPGSLDWRPFWRVDPKISGGGILTDVGIHYIYLVCSLLGFPERVSAKTRTVQDRCQGVEDTAVVHFHYPNGWVQLNLTWAAQVRQTRFVFVGSQATAAYDGETLSLQQNGTQEIEARELLSDKSSYMQWYVRLFREFIGRLEKDEPEFRQDGFVEAVVTQQILAACYRSARRGREVLLDL